MKKIALALAFSALTLGLPAAAHDLKTDTFQVTGTVSAVDDSSITVMKGKERFHISRDKDAKVEGELKVGAKVTVKYRMAADSITVAAEKAKADAKKK